MQDLETMKGTIKRLLAPPKGSAANSPTSPPPAAPPPPKRPPPPPTPSMASPFMTPLFPTLLLQRPAIRAVLLLTWVFIQLTGGDNGNNFEGHTRSHPLQLKRGYGQPMNALTLTVQSRSSNSFSNSLEWKSFWKPP